MQSVSSRIWTRVAVSIPYEDNPYTTGTSFLYIYIEYMISKYLVDNIFKQAWAHFLRTVKWFPSILNKVQFLFTQLNVLFQTI